MIDPYLTLGVGEDADDATIESAYLEAIKRCPPEHDAQRFESLRAAYETLRTRRDRVAHDLFDTSIPGPMELLNKAAPIGTPRRPEQALFAALLRGDD